MIQVNDTVPNLFKISASINRTEIKKGNAFKDEIYKGKPLVYLLINNTNKKIYIGETKDVETRMKKHLADDKKDFKEVYLITSDYFHKSSIYDIETLLIDHITGDGKYKVLNSKINQNGDDYTDNEMVRNNLFPQIWKELLSLGIVDNELEEVENLISFKYSPFKKLSIEQNITCSKIIQRVVDIDEERLENSVVSGIPSRFLIHGDPGTGKSMVITATINQLVKIYGMNPEKIAIVVPQSHLRKAISSVYKTLALRTVKVFTPSEFINHSKKYDLVFVEESHRLKEFFAKQAKDLKHLQIKDNEGKIIGTTNELEIIETYSQHLVCVYDKFQFVRPADINEETFKTLTANYERLSLTQQFRMKTSKYFLQWLRSLLQIENKNVYTGNIELGNYELDVLDSISELHQKIKNKDQEVKLSRMVSGYSREWISKKNPSLYDFEEPEHDYKAQWNTTIENWSNTETAIREIGCIHTTQGIDLNYVGVIIGKDIYYNEETGKIMANRKNYHDRNGSTIIKEDTTNNELLEYIKRIYYVLLTRGIQGCFLVVEDPALKKYIKYKIEEIK